MEKILKEKVVIITGAGRGIGQAAAKVVVNDMDASPEEATGPILFFASPLSDYVSGQVLLVTGGL